MRGVFFTRDLRATNRVTSHIVQVIVKRDARSRLTIFCGNSGIVVPAREIPKERCPFFKVKHAIFVRLILPNGFPICVAFVGFASEDIFAEKR